MRNRPYQVLKCSNKKRASQTQGGCTGLGSPGRRGGWPEQVHASQRSQTANAPSHRPPVAADPPRRPPLPDSRTVRSLPTPNISAIQSGLRAGIAECARASGSAHPCRRPLSDTHPPRSPSARSLARVHLPSRPPFFHGRQTTRHHTRLILMHAHWHTGISRRPGSGVSYKKTSFMKIAPATNIASAFRRSLKIGGSPR